MPEARAGGRGLKGLGRLIGLVRPHLGRFTIATLALLLSSGVGLAYPQIIKYAIDEGLSEGSVALLDQLLLGLVALFAAQAALVWVRHYFMSWLGERAVADLRRQVFARLVELPMAWFHERRAGEIVGRMASDVTAVEAMVGSELSIALRNAVQLIGGATLLFLEDPGLALLMVAVVPPLMVGAVAFGRVIRRMSKRVQDHLADTSGRAQEAIGAIQTVQAFGQEGRELAHYGEGVEAAFDAALVLTRWRATFISGVSVAGYLAIAGILWVGGRKVASGVMSGGELAAFMLYTSIVAMAVGSLASLWGALQRAAGATERLFEIIDLVPEIRDPAAPLPLPPGRGALSLRGVHFRYPSRPDVAVLEGVDLEVAPGEVVAVVGPSGAGKSTLMQLIQRFYDPEAGSVRLDGAELRDLRLAELRGALAVVSQEPVLFSGTLADNIAFGVPGASAEAIEAAAKGANAHDFITAFPEGYRTLIGERGVQLSGGQRQRVAIARALIRDPRLLLLDEATSALDSESEALVQEALGRLMRGRTTLVVAHRLSTVRDADAIVVLDGGAVVERGSHEALMAQGGLYRRLVEHQLVFAEAAPSPDAQASGGPEPIS